MQNSIKEKAMRCWILAVAVLVISPAVAVGEDVRISLWNGEELFEVSDVEDREGDIRDAVSTLNPDILLIDEVCSRAVVERVKEIMEDELAVDGLHFACSDFNQRDDQRHGSFEVGIISKFPLTKVVEFDVTPDNKGYGRDDEPSEVLLSADSLLKLGLDKASPGRGFLWARIDDLKMTICVTHLKSSRSGDERENAMKREYVAAAMALSVLDDLETFPDYSALVIGDLNVGATDAEKNGTDLDVDTIGDDSGDRYDDTHALLGGGLVHGLTMTNLTKDVGETYDSDRFVGSGPIDNIYVTGANEDQFSDGTKSDSTFGSDHFAVSTVYSVP